MSRGDKITLWLMAGIPTLVHVVFVWVPAFMTISLSFTKWDGLKLGRVAAAKSKDTMV